MEQGTSQQGIPSQGAGQQESWYKKALTMRMGWHDLAFLHWRVEASALRPLIPEPLVIDTFNGEAWIGVVPFRMTGVRPTFMPNVPKYMDFPEINLRTYVTINGKPGIWFFSLDTTSLPAVLGARTFFRLPYFTAKIDVVRKEEDIYYKSVRTGSTKPASFEATYRATGPIYTSNEGTLDYWLTERLCFYTGKTNDIWRCDIEHVRWPLQPAEAHVTHNHMFDQINLPNPTDAPLAHFAKDIEVVAYPLVRVP